MLKSIGMGFMTIPMELIFWLISSHQVAAEFFVFDIFFSYYSVDLERPAKLPNVDWVSDKINDDVRSLAKKYCSEEEKEWFEEVLRYSELTRIVWEGEEGEGGLPGRPGYVLCSDKTGKPWKAKIRALSKLPDDLWAVPGDRQAAEDAANMLTEAERLYVPRTSFVNEGKAEAHPPWMGARVLSEEEKRLHDFHDSSRFPAGHLKVSSLLADSKTAESLRKATVNELKSWLQEKGQRRSGNKEILIQRVLSCLDDSEERKQPVAHEERKQQVPQSRRRRKRRRIEPAEQEESKSESSDEDAPLVPPSMVRGINRNRPHSAARVRVRRVFARVYGGSDEERDAAGLREEGCQSDLSDSSSEGWLPPAIADDNDD